MNSLINASDPVAIAESARKARITAARTDINTFLELALVNEKTGKPVEQGLCHEEWHDACDRHDRVILYSHVESGKAVPLDTPIPTPAGWTTMGELRVGDEVFGADGLPHKVTWCSPIQYGRDVYAITFDDGVVELADADHNWLAWSIDDLAVHGSGKPRVVTTKEMLARVHRAGSKKRKQAKWHVPVASPVEYPKATLDVHPYVLGAWLGDGESTNSMLTVHEKDRMIADRCIELEGGRCGKWHRHKENPRVFKINIGGDDDRHTSHDPTRLRARLRRLGVLGNKHIPVAYLTASVAQRRELLAGLIDTDGYVSGDGKGRVEFSNTVQALAEGVLELVRSLGFTATCKKGTAKLNGKVIGDKWRVSWTPHEAVCKLPRKLSRQRLDGDRRWTRHRAVVNIRQVESCPVKCITVDSCDHTYLMGHSYTVTHNSQQMAIGRVLFELGRNPELRSAIISNTFLQARDRVDTVAKYILSSEALHAVFPGLQADAPWTSGAITVKRQIPKKDPSVRAVGVHGNILGARLDLVIMDDILDYENTRTPRARQDVWDWYHSTIVGRLTDNARVIVIGTAWHPEDILHRLADQPRWYCMKYPVEDNVGNPMWPAQWPKDRIDLKRTELGPLEFARQMLCQARDDAEARFQKTWIDQCLEAGEKCQPATSALDFFRKHPKLAPPAWFSEDNPELADAMDVINRMEVGIAGRFLTGVDLAVQRHSAADETVIFTLYLHPDGRRQPVEVLAGKWTGPEIVRNILSAIKRFGSTAIVENNACFPAGTAVLTQTGYKPIEFVKVGEFVWTHKARWRRVTKTLQGTTNSLIEAKAKGCLPVRATPNHWFYLREAGRLKGGRCAPGVGKHRPIGVARWVSYGFRDKPAYAAIALPRWASKQAVLHLRATTRQQARCIKITEKLAVVLGLYMAEGHRTRSQVNWTLGNHEMYLARFIARVVRDEIGCSVRISARHERGVIRVIANSSAFADAASFGTGAEKCLPLDCMGWALPIRLALIRGWLLGDGSVYLNNSRSRCPSWILRGDSISRNWMLFVRATLGHVGISTALRMSDRKSSSIEGRVVSRKRIYHITLSSSGSEFLRNRMSLDVEACKWAHWWGNVPDRKTRDHRGCLVVEAEHGWSRVPEIEDNPYIQYGGTVYNLEVEEDCSFTVEDFVVHNAQDFILQFAIEMGGVVPIFPFTTGKNKVNPVYGVESLAAEFANAFWLIPSKGGVAICPQMRQWIQEMLFYDPNGHTGDRLMASWFARELSRRVSAKVTRVGSKVVG